MRLAQDYQQTYSNRAYQVQQTAVEKRLPPR